jgi:hypothetical protein
MRPKTFSKFAAEFLRIARSVSHSAMKAFLNRELKKAYLAANQKLAADWEITSSDGLADEPW